MSAADETAGVAALPDGTYVLREERAAALEEVFYPPYLWIHNIKPIRPGTEPEGACPVCHKAVEAGTSVVTPLGPAVHLACATCRACGGWNDESVIWFTTLIPVGDDEIAGVIALHAPCFSAAYGLIEPYEPTDDASTIPTPGRYRPRGGAGNAAFRARFPSDVLWSRFLVDVHVVTASDSREEWCPVCRHRLDCTCGWGSGDGRLTARLEVPLHVKCLRCMACRRPVHEEDAIWVAFWHDDDGSEFCLSRLAHARCFRRVYEPRLNG